MEKNERIKRIKDLRKNDPIGSKDILYKGHRRPFDVYEIDLDCLIYNRFNGRIATHVKSYEKATGCDLDATKAEDIKKIEGFLWNSNKRRNKQTEKDIKAHGQLEYGIVTRDGVIIDGNRRAMILKRVKESYFRAIVLDDTLDENQKEIMRLETMYQMGEDQKVTYEPIEKYLKCKALKEHGFEDLDIANMMGESESRIKKYLSIMKLMDDYLDKLGYNGIYTRLDNTEGMFVDLDGYLNRYKGGKSSKVQWHYGDNDVSDLKLVYFDIIRCIHNSKQSSESGNPKEYRFIGQPNKKSSFFPNEDIWNGFRDRHFASVDSIREGESSIDDLRQQNPSQDLNELLRSRDEAWANEVYPHLKKNMGLGVEALDNQKKRDEPIELLRSAKGKLISINTDSESFLEDGDVYNLVDELRKLTNDFKTLIQRHQKRGKT